MIKLVKSTFYNERSARNELAKFVRSAPILSMGEQCRMFEEKFAKKQGRRYAVFVGSGSSANLVLIQALRNLEMLSLGEHVGFSALTWPTNLMPIIQLGLKPIPIDCAINTLNVSLDTIKKLGKKPKCIFITNVLGFADNLPAIAAYCKKEKILLLEDNCESLGSRIGGKLLGNFGLASTFSFYVAHHLSTIEGGMICTDDEKLRDMLVMVRAHGWDRSLAKDKQTQLRKSHKVDDFFDKFTFYHLAYNVRPTELQGFLGNNQLKYWDTIVRTREKNFMRLNKAIAQNKAFEHLVVDHMSIVSNFAVPIICKDERSFKKYKALFEEAGVEIRPIIAGNMQHQPFYKKYNLPATPCPNTDAIHARGFYFTNNPDLTEKELSTLEALLA